MKKILLSIVLVLVLAVPGWAGHYYISNSGNDSTGDGSIGNPWKTFAGAFAAHTPVAGDIIDGKGEVYYEYIDVPSSGSSGGGYITYQNFILDGTASIDGSWTFSPSNTYSNTEPWQAYSGEVYGKGCANIPFQMFEDGTKLTPVVALTEQEAGAIGRGTYTYYDGYIFYRATDGSNPTTNGKHVRMSNRAWDGRYGTLAIDAKSYISLSNVTVRYSFVTTSGSVGIMVSDSDHILMQNCTMPYCRQGMGLYGTVTNLTATGLDINYSCVGGIIIGGSVDDISLQGSFTYNGFEKYYDRVSYDHQPDGDGIGIGGDGGTIGTVTIHGSTFGNNGDPTGATSYGAGIYVGTTSSMNVDKLIIKNNFFYNNNRGAIRLDGNETEIAQVSSWDIYNNIFINHTLYETATVLLKTDNASFAASKIVNNVFYGNTKKAALDLFLTAATDNYVTCQNNIFMNNGASSGWTADIMFEAQCPVTLGYNLYYRSAGAWSTTANVFYNWGDTYSMTQSATWSSATGATNEIYAQNPLFVNAGGSTAADYQLQAGSPCRAAGVNVGLTTDYRGVGYTNPPSIGAYQWSKIGGVLNPGKVMGTSNYKAK